MLLGAWEFRFKGQDGWDFGPAEFGEMPRRPLLSYSKEDSLGKLPTV